MWLVAWPTAGAANDMLVKTKTFKPLGNGLFPTGSHAELYFLINHFTLSFAIV